MKCLVINLDESHERLANITVEFERIGGAFERVAAVEADACATIAATLPHVTGWPLRQLSLGEVACLLSHRACWTRAAASSDAGSVPVYWGSPRAGEEFNPATFIDFHGEEAKLRRFFRLGAATNLPRPVKALVQSLALLRVALRVIRADRIDSAYQAFFAEPCIADGARRFLDQQPVRDRWQAIFAAARRQTG